VFDDSEHSAQRVANMNRSRFVAGFFLITCMLIFLLIFLIIAKPAMGYYLLLCVVFFSSDNILLVLELIEILKIVKNRIVIKKTDEK